MELLNTVRVSCFSLGSGEFGKIDCLVVGTVMNSGRTAESQHRSRFRPCEIT